jgi:hypothetical protein
MKKKKKAENISRRAFLHDTGKTIFYTTLGASVLPAFLTSCSKEDLLGSSESSGSINENVVTMDGQKAACAKAYVCYDEYDCGPPFTFNCNNGFDCDDYDCLGGHFNCRRAAFNCIVIFDCKDDFKHVGGGGS